MKFNYLNKKFIDNFKSYMYDFETVDDHAKHLAQLEARGMIRSIVEGYGLLKEEMNCSVNVVDQFEEIVSSEEVTNGG